MLSVPDGTSVAERRDVIKGLAAASIAAKASFLSAGTRAMISTPPAAALPSWEDQMRLLMPLGERMIRKWGRPSLTEAERQDMYTLVLAMLSEAYLCHVYMDPKRPVWSPLWNMAYNQGGPNPDYVYGMAQVDPDGIYRISGFRGTNRFVDITQQALRIFPPLAEMKPAPAVNDLDGLTLARLARS